MGFPFNPNPGLGPVDPISGQLGRVNPYGGGIGSGVADPCGGGFLRPNPYGGLTAAPLPPPPPVVRPQPPRTFIPRVKPAPRVSRPPQFAFRPLTLPIQSPAGPSQRARQQAPAIVWTKLPIQTTE
jgi:hypothetical protein